MLLSRIEITDFLSVRGKLPIDLDKKVTILLGSNDHGKSNVLRAIEHLNDDTPITDDERNWDAEGEPEIVFTLNLTRTEIEEWKKIVQDLRTRTSEGDQEAAPAPTAPAAGTSAVAPTAGKTPLTAPPATQTKQTGAEIDLPEAALAANAKSLTLARKGVGSALTFYDCDIADLPGEMSAFMTKKLPRVELFKTLTGNLQDSANASTIVSEEYEFLQGVFFYAGLDPLKSGPLFTQDDRTMRKLNIASKQLDRSLRNLWGQGTELHFELAHKGSEILFLADDPAIKSRKARMSKRSAGVTQFFRVSMVLYARRKKHPANSYIYLFDEPGVLLHPQGQRDLLQVFEQLADENQIIYATHSLFLLNQNFPERHRLIYKDHEGTKVDHKPYRQNWKLATDALGVYLSSNILFSNRIALVEGDSDPIYLYELLRQLNRIGEMDVDLNTLGIMSFYDTQNLRFLLQVFKREREGAESSVCVLVDGDTAGKTILQNVSALCKKLNVPTLRLAEGRSIEDYCLHEDEFLQAAVKAIEIGCESEGKTLPKDTEERVRNSWEEFKSASEKAERKSRPEKAEKDERDVKKTAGRWFKDLAKEIVGDEVSKVVLARSYAEICREIADATPDRDKVKEAKSICQEIGTKLSLPSLKAAKTIESQA